MKRIILFVAALLFLDLVAAKSVQSNLNDNLVLIYSQGQSHDLGRQGVYNYSTLSKVQSIGFMQNIPLTPTINVGLGLMFGGIEIEIETQSSMVRFRDADIDIDGLLRVNAKIEFADIIPYVNLGYHLEDRKQRLSFSANAGIKLLQLSSVSVTLDGEVGDLLEHQTGVVSRLQDAIRQDLDAYYLEPVISMHMNYLFN
ncbi:MAG: hypothetical protein IIB69_00455 [Proteobacteria bacterium]|nr:hypothetical protein [Pseudomonadota bacterium]MCH8177423.1 hypothetical protein [Pseudomonadota bacterium]